MKRPNRTEINRSNTLDRTGVMEIGLIPDSREDIEPFGKKTLLQQLDQLEEKDPQQQSAKNPTQLRSKKFSQLIKEQKKKPRGSTPPITSKSNKILSSLRDLKTNVQNLGSRWQDKENATESRDCLQSKCSLKSSAFRAGSDTSAPQHPEMVEWMKPRQRQILSKWPIRNVKRKQIEACLFNAEKTEPLQQCSTITSIIASRWASLTSI